MANAHSKARARASEPFWLFNEPQLPPDPEQARRYTDLMRFSGTALAMSVIRNLLRCNEAFHRAKPVHSLPGAGAWPLTPTQVEGLRAALYFLRVHGEGMLQAERLR